MLEKSSKNALIILGLAWIYFYSGVGASIETQCSVMRNGDATCRITNTGWTPRAMCAVVSVAQIPINESSGKVSSRPVCFGRVWPDDTVQRDTRITIPSDFCDTTQDQKWADVCEVQMDYFNNWY